VGVGLGWGVWGVGVGGGLVGLVGIARLS
jgi:hypothetical protein